MKRWGKTFGIELTEEELRTSDPVMLQQILYRHKLIKVKLPLLTHDQLYSLVSKFGIPWTPEEYLRSGVHMATILGTETGRFITKNRTLHVSDKQKFIKLGWHCDVPVKRNPYPFRSMYCFSTPPASGITSWTNTENIYVDKIHDSIKMDVRDIYDLTHLETQDLVQVHPKTGKKYYALNSFDSQNWRLNFANRDLNDKSSWITRCYEGDEDRCDVLNSLIKKAVDAEAIHHPWAVGDFIIYDNRGMMHKRTKIELDPTQERSFFMMNLNYA